MTPPTRLTAEQLDKMADESGLVLQPPHRVTIQAFRQAARDARVLEGLRAWLAENARRMHEKSILSSDTFGRLAALESGLLTNDVLNEIDRLEREP